MTVFGNFSNGGFLTGGGSDVPDPIIPGDGDLNITGDLSVSGDVSGATATITGDLSIGTGGQILADDGAQAAPSIAFADGPTVGLLRLAGQPTMAVNNNIIQSWGQGQTTITKSAFFQGIIAVGDVGDGATARNDGTLRTADATGSPTDIAGADLTIRPGIGSGAGDVGQLIFQTPRVEASGTTLQTPTTLVTMDEDQVAIDGDVEATGDITSSGGSIIIDVGACRFGSSSHQLGFLTAAAGMGIRVGAVYRLSVIGTDDPGAIVIGDQAGDTLRTSAKLTARDLTSGNTDVAGADLTIRPGIGSGAGDVGQLIFQTPRVETSGTTLQTPTTLMTLDEDTVSIAGNLALTDASGTLGFFGSTPVVRTAAYTITNVTPDRAYDANTSNVAELADVLGTLIADLQSYGLLQ